jgi:hypothetical protein
LINRGALRWLWFGSGGGGENRGVVVVWLKWVEGWEGLGICSVTIDRSLALVATLPPDPNRTHTHIYTHTHTFGGRHVSGLPAQAADLQVHRRLRQVRTVFCFSCFLYSNQHTHTYRDRNHLTSHSPLAPPRN